MIHVARCDALRRQQLPKLVDGEKADSMVHRDSPSLAEYAAQVQVVYGSQEPKSMPVNWITNHTSSSDTPEQFPI